MHISSQSVPPSKKPKGSKFNSARATWSAALHHKLLTGLKQHGLLPHCLLFGLFSDANKELQLHQCKCYPTQEAIIVSEGNPACFHKAAGNTFRTFWREEGSVSGPAAFHGVWVWLTCTSFIDGPESRATGLALEGANSVDADAIGTGARISALIYICLRGKWKIKTLKNWISCCNNKLTQTLCTSIEERDTLGRNAGKHTHTLVHKTSLSWSEWKFLPGFAQRKTQYVFCYWAANK